ncbi:MAG: FG-GAP-like repeat-containing protein [Candidatus Njordarchaeales archaeon]
MLKRKKLLFIFFIISGVLLSSLTINFLRTSFDNWSGREKNQFNIIWKFKTSSFISYGPVVVDLENDGFPEVVLLNVEGVYVLNGFNGSVKWFKCIDQPHSDYALYSFALGDVSGDGVLDIVFIGDIYPDWIGSIGALDGVNGSLLWEVRLKYLLTDTLLVGLGDLNSDGHADAVTYDGFARLYAVDGSDGSILWVRSIGRVPYVFALGDLDNDDGDDVVVGGGDHLVALDGETGEIIWVNNEAKYYPIIADFNKDGSLEVLAFGQNNAYLINGENGSIIWTSPDFEEVASYHTIVTDLAQHLLSAVGDINGDGFLDIVVLHDSWRKLYIISGSDGSLLLEKDIGVLFKELRGVHYASDIILADLDNDMQLDILFYIPFDNIAPGKKMIYALDGQSLTLLWYFEAPAWADLVAISLGDLDNDEYSEIVYRGESVVYALKCSCFGKLVYWEGFGGSPSNSFNVRRFDRDFDGLSDRDEVLLGTNPVSRDSDGDGYGDYVEVYHYSDPLDPTSIPRQETGWQRILYSTPPAVAIALVIVYLYKKKSRKKKKKE